MWYDVLAYGSWASSLLPLAFIIAARGTRLNVVLKLVLLLKTLSFLTDGIALFLVKNKISNSELINFYVAIEFLILLWVYNIFFGSERWKWLFIGLAGGLVVYVLYLMSVTETFSDFSNHLNTISAIIVVVFSIFAFNRLVGQFQEVTTNYFFWINSAFMLYYLCNLALFLFKAYILSTNASADTSRIWAAHNFFHICSNILLLGGFRTWRKQNSSNTSLSGS